MSKEELAGLIQQELNGDADLSSRRDRQFKTAKQGNSIFAQNIGNPIYEYLNSVYLERVKTLIEETYEERIKKLEELVGQVNQTKLQISSLIENVNLLQTKTTSIENELQSLKVSISNLENRLMSTDK